MYNKKDIELSPEETLAITRRQCAPFWYNAEPLIVGLIDEETKKASVYPIDLEFPKFAWLIFFIDLSSPSFEGTLKLAEEWINRFNALQIKPLFVVKESYDFFKERLVMRPIFEKYELIHPIVIDVDNAIQKAFSINDYPSVILFDKEKVIFSEAIGSSYSLIEEKIHLFLRNSDPGLPLKRLFNINNLIQKTDFILEMGKNKSKNYVIEKTLSEIVQSEVHFVGSWKQDKDCIFTSDENAQIHFKSSTENLSFFCRTLNKNEEVSRVYLQLDDGPVYDLFAGKELRFDDENRSFLNVREAQLYSVLNGLPEDKRLISCTIPWAKKSTFALFKICGYNN